MKKVLIFSLAYFPKHVGGAEVAIKEITDRIPPALYEFHMVTLRFDSTLPKLEKIGNIFVHRIGFTTRNPSMADLRKFPLHFNKFLFQFSAFFKALSLHKQYSFDGIWAMMAHSCGAPASLFKTIHPEVKFVLTLQEGDPPEYIQKKMRIFYPAFERAFTSADIIQSISTFLANWGKTMGATCPSIVIPNAVDIKHFSQNYSGTEIAEVRNKLGVKTGDVLLITTSRLVKKNAVDDVIKALPLLSTDIHFLILGTGPDEKELRTLATTLGVESHTHFLSQINHKNLPKYLKASDIFIRPSLSEGMGNSFVEAMATGLPVIATPVGGIVDFLKDSETGLFCEVRNPESIAMQVKRLIDNPALRQTLVTNASKMVVEKYDWDIVARDMKEKVFDTVLKN